MGRGLDGYFVMPADVGKLCSFEGPRVRGLYRFPVALAWGKHLFPFRTEQLSPTAPMVLGLHGPGRVGRRRFFFAPTSRPTRRLVVVEGGPGRPARFPHPQAAGGARAAGNGAAGTRAAGTRVAGARAARRRPECVGARGAAARRRCVRRPRPPRPGTGAQGRSEPAGRPSRDRRDADLCARAAHTGPARAGVTTERSAVRVLGRGGGGPGLPDWRTGRCLAQRGELQGRVNGAAHQLAERALGRATCRQGWEHVFARLGSRVGRNPARRGEPPTLDADLALGRDRRLARPASELARAAVGDLDGLG